MMGLQLSPGLSERELAEIRQLEEICRENDVLNMKLNWEMLQHRPAGEINDLLYYRNDQLVGFMGLYRMDPGSREIEITGMVHPGYRRRNIGRQMIAKALELCAARRGVDRILLIAERSSASGTCFAKAAGFRYAVSEYRMRFTAADVPEVLTQGIRLRKANRSDEAILAHINALCFGLPEKDVADQVETDSVGYGRDATYVAELDERIIGKIGVINENSEGYIFGFGVFPEFRGRGYGRAILCLTVSKLLSENIKSTLLEVATQNENALHLYQSCGFRTITVYDYYELGMG